MDFLLRLLQKCSSCDKFYSPSLLRLFCLIYFIYSKIKAENTQCCLLLSYLIKGNATRCWIHFLCSKLWYMCREKHRLLFHSNIFANHLSSLKIGWEKRNHFWQSERKQSDLYSLCITPIYLGLCYENIERPPGMGKSYHVHVNHSQTPHLLPI